MAAKSHKGVLQQFGLHVIKAGTLPEEFSDILKDAADQRELADYHAMAGDFDPGEVRQLIENARRFVEQMEELLKQ